ASDLGQSGVSQMSRNSGSGFSGLTHDPLLIGTGSLAPGAAYLSKKRCAGNRLARRGSQSLYLAFAP
ncbi:MAG: hypothetical protein ABJB40_05145, partial [Acidobacteriota bacterium]